MNLLVLLKVDDLVAIDLLLFGLDLETNRSSPSSANNIFIASAFNEIGTSSCLGFFCDDCVAASGKKCLLSENRTNQTNQTNRINRINEIN